MEHEMRPTISPIKAVAVAAFIGVVAMPGDADAGSVTCRSSCKVRFKLEDGKPVLRDDPIVIASGHSKVHVNWHAPAGWEFVDGSIGLKSPDGSTEFDQWCASDVDNDSCSTKKAKAKRYHCRALNTKAGTFEYRLRLRKIGTTEEQEIDPSIVNQGR